ncbi:MAG: hypothetical protein QM703_25805 [Gemmatales bacterium]
MFYALLILAVLQLLICNWAMYQKKRPIGFAFWCCFLLPMLGIILMTQLHSAFLLAILLGLLMLFWKRLHFSSRSFTGMSVLGVCLFIGGCGGLAYQGIERLRTEYPIVSLADRLPVPANLEIEKASLQSTQLVEGLDQHYDKDRESPRYYVSNRTAALTQLHSSVYYLFISSPQFGVMRMPTAYTRLWRGDYEARDPSQPLSPFKPMTPMALSLSEVDGLTGPSTTIFRPMLFMNITQFVPTNSLGYVKDHKQAAGFLPHGQRDYVRPDDYHTGERHEVFKHYTLLRLDLISLLLHEMPVAYLTDTLPAMDKMKELKTRPLDAFEAVALLKLRGGEDLYAREYQGSTRLLGALRNAKKCMTCHDGAYGELLGAFSYDLKHR